MYLGARDSILHLRAIAKSNRPFHIRQASTSRPASEKSSFKRASRPGYHLSVGGLRKMDFFPERFDM